MGKIAFVFSGQGDQYPGMGKDLYEKYESAKLVFDTCEKLRPGTIAQCFEGTEEELKETKNTQACLFAMELAAASILSEKGIKPDAVAGFSLGEVVAATVAGIFNKETGFKLVCKRGELMQKASAKVEASMAAVVKLDDKIVEDLSKKYSQVYLVNYNCPGQITVSGEATQMEEFAKDVKEAGGRALPLKVKGGFHSPFMVDAAEAFSVYVSEAQKNPMEICLYSNMTAEPYTDDVVTFLSKQICSPVKWELSIRNMIERGVDTFIEMGPGKTLSNMIKKIDPAVNACGIYEYLEENEIC